MSESDQYVCDWETQYNEQCRINYTINNQLNVLKLNENQLTDKLKELEDYKKCTVIELDNYKTEIENKNSIMEKLETTLKSKEQELCDLHAKLKEAYNRSDLELATIENADTISHKKQVENKFKFEQDVLTNKFNIVCKKLRETKIAFDEAKHIINHDIHKINNVVIGIAKQSEEEKNNQRKMMILAEQLKEEICIKDSLHKELCQFNMKIIDLQRKNECNILKIHKQKKIIARMEVDNKKR